MIARAAAFALLVEALRIAPEMAGAPRCPTMVTNSPIKHAIVRLQTV
jgi:hypothetical protein